MTINNAELEGMGLTRKDLEQKEAPEKLYSTLGEQFDDGGLKQQLDENQGFIKGDSSFQQTLGPQNEKAINYLLNNKRPGKPGLAVQTQEPVLPMLDKAGSGLLLKHSIFHREEPQKQTQKLDKPTPPTPTKHRG